MNYDFDVLQRVVGQRRSVRAFLPDAVDQELLERIFKLAQQAPSNCNTQPWQVHVVSGLTAEKIKQALQQHLAQGEMQMDYSFIPKYSGVYKERQYDAARQLYGAMGIERQDMEGRHQAFMRNFKFFDAPYAALLFMPEDFSTREAADVGMFAQNLMLALTANGLASCPQAALSFHADCVREILGVEDKMKLLFGIAFGYEDTTAAVNATRVGRADLKEAVHFHR